MNGDTASLCSIGELARLTGLTVKTIRFYSDSGIVTPSGRTPAGYRLYGVEAVARLGLVRTLRELGIGLPAVRMVMDREIALPAVAAAHAEALDVQIHQLRLRRALLGVVAEHGYSPEELDLMHQLSKLSEDERGRLIDDFLATAFNGLHGHPALTAVIRSMTPELPARPEPEQLAAWVELAKLLQDHGFRASVQGMAQDLAADRTREGSPGLAASLPRILAEAVRSLAERALAEGIDPTSPEARPLTTALAARYAHRTGRPDDAALRAHLAERLETLNDPRRDRYLSLLAVVNGWSAPDGLAPALNWAIEALRAGA
jgi:DNA-binding transcriptional MerR regulator